MITLLHDNFIIVVLSHISPFIHAESTPLRPSTSVASGIGNGNARRRPMSSYHLEPRSPRASPVPLQFPITSGGGGGGGSAAADKKGQASSKSPYHAPQANAYPAPSQPAPPPPPRTVSKNAEPVPRYVLCTERGSLNRCT